MLPYQSGQVGQAGFVGHGGFLELVRHLGLIDDLPAIFLQGIGAPTSHERTERATAVQARLQWLQLLPEGLDGDLNLLLAVLDRLVNELLERANAGEITVKVSLIILIAEIIAYLTHPGTEHLGIDVGRKREQVTAVVKEFPLAFLGIAMGHVAHILLDPNVDLRCFHLLAERQEEIVQGDAHSILFVQLNIVVEVTVKLAGKIAQYALEKRVNRAHIEVAIVKQELI